LRSGGKKEEKGGEKRVNTPLIFNKGREGGEEEKKLAVSDFIKVALRSSHPN